MSEKRLRFRTKIEGEETGVVAAITPPVDVIEWFGTRAAGAHPRNGQRICISLVSDADG
jgi:hypothetical protein